MISIRIPSKNKVQKTLLIGNHGFAAMGKEKYTICAILGRVKSIELV